MPANPGPAMAVPVLQKSGPFRGHAWDMLRTVAPGHPVTYTEYAALSGNAKAVRAAASACAFNAAALFVPCHRVIRTDGSLGGFRWGLAIKESLLDRERERRLATHGAEVRLRAHAAAGHRRGVHPAEVSAGDGHPGGPRQQLRKVDAVGRRGGAQAAEGRRASGEPGRDVGQHAVDRRRPAAGGSDGHRGQAERLEHEPLPFRHPGGQEIEELLAERPAPGFRPAARAEVGGMDDELAPQRQAAVEDDSPAVADGRLPAGVVQRFEGAQGPVQCGVQVGPVFREGVPGGHLDGAGPALVAAVVELDALTAGGEFQLAGHRVGDAADVGQHVPAGPARQFRGRSDVLFASVWRRFRSRRRQRGGVLPGGFPG